MVRLRGQSSARISRGSWGSPVTPARWVWWSRWGNRTNRSTVQIESKFDIGAYNHIQPNTIWSNLDPRKVSSISETSSVDFVKVLGTETRRWPGRGSSSVSWEKDLRRFSWAPVGGGAKGAQTEVPSISKPEFCGETSSVLAWVFVVVPCLLIGVTGMDSPIARPSLQCGQKEWWQVNPALFLCPCPELKNFLQIRINDWILDIGHPNFTKPGPACQSIVFIECRHVTMRAITVDLF